MTHRKLETRKNVPRGRDQTMNVPCQFRLRRPPEDLHLHPLRPLLTVLAAELLSGIVLVISMVIGLQDPLLILVTNLTTHLDIAEIGNMAREALLWMMSCP
jgi:hypothetical protein